MKGGKRCYVTRAHTGLLVVWEAVWVTGQEGDWLAGREAPFSPHGRALGAGQAE